MIDQLDPTSEIMLLVFKQKYNEWLELSSTKATLDHIEAIREGSTDALAKLNAMIRWETTINEAVARIFEEIRNLFDRAGIPHGLTSLDLVKELGDIRVRALDQSV